MAITWSSIDEIDACNSDLVMAIIEAITGNTIQTKIHLILWEDLFRRSPKQSITKNYDKEICVPSPYLQQVHQRGRRRGALGGDMAAASPRSKGA